MFAIVDHCTGEAWVDAAPRMDRWAAADLLREAILDRFGSVEAGAAAGLKLRHDGGSCFRSGHYQAEIDHLGIDRSPAFVYEPETNGVVEKFLQTLKEQVLWIERFDTLEQLRARVRQFAARLQRALAARTPRLPLTPPSPRRTCTVRRPWHDRRIHQPGVRRTGGGAVDDFLRELRPRFLPPPRSFQRTRYRPGELAQFDLWEPRSRDPGRLGPDAPRLRRHVRAALLARVRRHAGVLEGVPGHRVRDEPLPCSGSARCRGSWSGTARARSRRGAARPSSSSRSAAQLALGWVILDAGDCQAKGALERSHRFMHGNFEAGRRFANPLDFQAQLDGWCDRINARVHRTTRAVVAERLAEEHARMRPLPAAMPDSDRRFVMRVPAQPYLRFDRNDYSLDPRLAGRRVEVRVSQREMIAVALDTGELAAPPRARVRRRPHVHRPRPPGRARPAARRAPPRPRRRRRAAAAGAL